MVSEEREGLSFDSTTVAIKKIEKSIQQISQTAVVKWRDLLGGREVPRVTPRSHYYWVTRKSRSRINTRPLLGPMCVLLDCRASSFAAVLVNTLYRLSSKGS
jgi:hypothetical protein